MRSLRRPLFAALLLAVAVGAPAAAQNTVSLEEGAITFELPEGFTEFTAEELDIKYPDAPTSRRYAYGTRPDLTSSLAITISPASVAPHQLPLLKEQMEEVLPKASPGIRFVTREMVSINGWMWVHLEITSRAAGGQVHNHMFLTSFRGKMLGINFNTSEEKYAELADQLLRSSRSIRLTP